jgi:hypothetical protein
MSPASVQLNKLSIKDYGALKRKGLRTCRRACVTQKLRPTWDEAVFYSAAKTGVLE